MNGPRTGILQNRGQFALLVLINALVGAMVGLERTVLPVLAEESFGLAHGAALTSFIAVFGLSKALANYLAGYLADRYGRRPVLVVGWLLALPVPPLLMFAPTWEVVVAANGLLGISQGLSWSSTVIMKIDLAGPHQRGLAMGLNEFAGYLAVGGSALATGYLATRYGLRPAPFAMGVGFAVVGVSLSVLAARETRPWAIPPSQGAPPPPASQVFLRASFTDRDLSAVAQAGFVNNLNDGVAWGLFPLLFTQAGLGLDRIGILTAVYPAIWGLGQLATGPASDRIGRKPLIVLGMLFQAGALAMIAVSDRFGTFLAASIFLGAGTAMVYPTLLAVIGDVAPPSWRASAVGIYRLWRDGGYAAGALLAGLIAYRFGLHAAVGATALLTLGSGLFAAVRLRETNG